MLFITKVQVACLAGMILLLLSPILLCLEMEEAHLFLFLCFFAPVVDWHVGDGMWMIQREVAVGSWYILFNVRTLQKTN
jgi:hypothetical protein